MPRQGPALLPHASRRRGRAGQGAHLQSPSCFPVATGLHSPATLPGRMGRNCSVSQPASQSAALATWNGQGWGGGAALRSSRPTLAPRALASLAQASPPEPPPRTSKSKCCSTSLLVARHRRHEAWAIPALTRASVSSRAHIGTVRRRAQLLTLFASTGIGQQFPDLLCVSDSSGAVRHTLDPGTEPVSRIVQLPWGAKTVSQRSVALVADGRSALLLMSTWGNR